MSKMEFQVNSNSPKTSRQDSKRTSSTSNNTSANNSSDLLGLSSSTTTSSPNTSAINKSDSFDSFLCDVSGTASSTSGSASLATNQNSNNTATNGSSNNTLNSLEKEEKDFFNQSINNNGVTDKGKLTKDSILALYGMNSYAPAPQQTFPQMTGQGFGGFPPPQQANPQMFPNVLGNVMLGAQQQMPPLNATGSGQPHDQFYNFGNRLPMQPPSQGQFMNLNHNNNSFGNFAMFPAGTSTSSNPYQQQFNTQKLSEDNIKKIESLNFNNLK